MHEEEEDEEDIPSPVQMAGDAAATEPSEPSDAASGHKKKHSLGKIARGAIFREVVLAKVREVKENEEREKVEREAREKASHG